MSSGFADEPHEDDEQPPDVAASFIAAKSFGFKRLSSEIVNGWLMCRVSCRWAETQTACHPMAKKKRNQSLTGGGRGAFAAEQCRVAFRDRAGRFAPMRTRVGIDVRSSNPLSRFVGTRLGGEGRTPCQEFAISRKNASTFRGPPEQVSGRTAATQGGPSHGGGRPAQISSAIPPDFGDRSCPPSGRFGPEGI